MNDDTKQQNHDTKVEQAKKRFDWNNLTNPGHVRYYYYVCDECDAWVVESAHPRNGRRASLYCMNCDHGNPLTLYAVEWANGDLDIRDGFEDVGFPEWVDHD